MESRALRQQRAKLIRDAQALNDQGITTQEQENQYNRLMDEAEQLRHQYERMERELELSLLTAQLEQPIGSGPIATRDDHWQPGTGPGYEQRSNPYAGSWRHNGGEDRSKLLSEVYVRRDLLGWDLPQELRALSHGTDTEGGYLTPDEAFQQRVVRSLPEVTPFMQLATVILIEGTDTLGAPSVDNEGSDPSWTTELSLGDEDSELDFGKRSLTVHPLRKYVYVSKTLLRRAPFAAEIVESALARKNGEALENAFMVGNGSQKPLGIFVASEDGISTSRDISTGNTSTAVTMDGLINAVHHVASQYRPRCRWVCHDDFVKQVRKLKDGEGQFLWQPSTQAGQPDTLLGYPISISAFAPSVFTSGNYVAAFLDPSYYWIAQELAFMVEVFRELRAAQNQMVFASWCEIDGMFTLEAAAARVKLG